MAIDQLFLRAGLRGPAPAITSLNFHANLRLAAQGGLLAVAPRSVFKTVASVLERLPIPVDWVTRTAASCWPGASPASGTPHWRRCKPAFEDDCAVSDRPRP
jgi:DNA-binding transcriptional LysR family regulator